MSLDKLVNHLIEVACNETKRDKPQSLHAFKIVKQAGELIKPSRTKAEHHRSREVYYTKELEVAEKKMREEGITVDITDAAGVTYPTGGITSGAMYGQQNQFAPRIDQSMLDAVKRAKTKMVEHREKAEKYEKFARAFSCAPGLTVELTVDDVYFFGLQN